jgi:hypothetical protein
VQDVEMYEKRFYPKWSEISLSCMKRVGVFFYPKLSESGIVGCKAFYYVELEVRQCSTSE